MGFKFGIKKNILIMKSQVYRAKYRYGGDYLSNEIFYRVAKLRDEWIKSKLPTVVTKPTGHFHIAMLQDKEKGKPDFSPSETKDLLNIVKQAIIRGVNAL
jgi:hypothetical protein